MGRKEKLKKYTFSGHIGYVVAPWVSNTSYDIVAIRHSANVEPWVDNDVHLHEDSDEFYFLLSGKLWLLVDDQLITLEPNEFLQVRKNISHAVVKGEGKIEHFIIRVPASEDRKVWGGIPEEMPELAQRQERELREDWGNRVSIENEENRDCWLFGIGQAKLHSPQMCLAYMRYPTQKVADGYKKAYHHCYHAHLESWEYYTVLAGAKTLRVEDEYVTVNAGEILEVPPGVKHIFHELKAPFEGFTFRTPVLNDKIEY
jgi:mannose-6-phosphate isomerase-like protein (cupin superfamily)